MGLKKIGPYFTDPLSTHSQPIFDPAPLRPTPIFDPYLPPSLSLLPYLAPFSRSPPLPLSLLPCLTSIFPARTPATSWPGRRACLSFGEAAAGTILEGHGPRRRHIGEQRFEKAEHVGHKAMDFQCHDLAQWTAALSAYHSRIESLDKPHLLALDNFYCCRLPASSTIATPTLSSPVGISPNSCSGSPPMANGGLFALLLFPLREKSFLVSDWACDGYCVVISRPSLVDFGWSLDEDTVESSSRKTLGSLPSVSQAVSELTVLKGAGLATASAVLANTHPMFAPFISDEERERGERRRRKKFHI